jgi:hypothetical protein
MTHKANDLIISQNANLRFDIPDEPVCFESSYQSGTGKFYPEFFLNEYSTNVLAASYEPVIARKLLKRNFALMVEMRKLSQKRFK